jgi:hypothetical protein
MLRDRSFADDEGECEICRILYIKNSKKILNILLTYNVI